MKNDSTTEQLIKSIIDRIDRVAKMNVLPDPRSYTEFADKAKALKGRVKVCVDLVLSKTIPSELRTYIMENCVLSGSSIASIYHTEEPKDYDFWFKHPGFLDKTSEKLQKEYNDYIAEYSEEYNGMTKTCKVVTGNAITFVDKIQVITLGDYETMRKLFDFVHCLPYYDLKDDKFYISEHQLNVIAQKKLEVNPGGKTPAQSRIEKFNQRGWAF